MTAALANYRAGHTPGVRAWIQMLLRLARGLAIRISHNHRTAYDYIPAFGNLAWERSGAAAEPRP